MGIASGKNNSVVTLHTLLSDMPSADNEDHDGRYYTETEVNTILGDYFLEDGQSDNIVNGTFDLTTTGKLGATVLENTAGDLKLQPDGQGEISLFEDRDWNGVADYTSFNMHRKDSSATGNSRFRMRIDPSGQGYFGFTGNHFVFSGGGDLRYTAAKNLDLRQTDPTYAVNLGSRWDEDENQKVRYYGGDGSVVKYVQFQLGSDMYFKTTPKDATVLGWNMDLPLDLLNNDFTIGTGTGTFGQIIDSGLTASLGVYTDSNKQLTSSPPAGGVLGYWSKTGTTISTATAGDDLTIDGDITGDNLSGDNTGDQNNYNSLDNLPNLGTASAQDVGYFEPAKGTDDNFVTDYQLSILSTLVSHTWVNS